MYNHLTKEHKWFEDGASILRPKYAATRSQVAESFPSLFNIYRTGHVFLLNDIVSM